MNLNHRLFVFAGASVVLLMARTDLLPSIKYAFAGAALPPNIAIESDIKYTAFKSVFESVRSTQKTCFTVVTHAYPRVESIPESELASYQQVLDDMGYHRTEKFEPGYYYLEQSWRATVGKLDIKRGDCHYHSGPPKKIITYVKGCTKTYVETEHSLIRKNVDDTGPCLGRLSPKFMEEWAAAHALAGEKTSFGGLTAECQYKFPPHFQAKGGPSTLLQLQHSLGQAVEARHCLLPAIPYYPGPGPNWREVLIAQKADVGSGELGTYDMIPSEVIVGAVSTLPVYKIPDAYGGFKVEDFEAKTKATLPKGYNDDWAKKTGPDIFSKMP